MRIELTCKLNQPHYFVACSGGRDSIFAAEFLRQYKPNVKITLAYMHHGEPTREAWEQVFATASSIGAGTITQSIKGSAEDFDGGIESFWREQRYEWLESLQGPVIVAHNLNDVAETWLMSALHGTPKLIPVTRNNIIRPFLLTSRATIDKYCDERGLPWYEDPTNQDVEFTARNRIRHNILPEVLKVNPGLLNMLARKLRTKLEEES